MNIQYTMRRLVDVVTNRNYVYWIACRVIWCPKYGCDELRGPIADELDTRLAATIQRYIERDEQVTKRR